MNKIFLFTVLFISLKANAANYFLDDSTGIEKKDGKVFILHQVEPKETLYSISKRYGVTVDEIKKYNTEAAAGLKIGQTLWVPSKAKISSAQNTSVKASQPSSGPQTHNVAAKETLFSISKKYNVSIDDLKKANPEIASGLKAGQVIIIPGKGSKPVEPTTAVKEDKKEEEKKSDDKKEKKAEEKLAEEKKADEKRIKEEENRAREEKKAAELKEKEAAQAKENKIKDKEGLAGLAVTNNTSSVGGYTKISETGIGELLENNDTQKYLALHKTAPIGTIIQVVNLGNNKKVFVKVIGTTPAGAGSNVVIQMTAKAFEQLATSSSEKQIKTEISYIKD
jgi:LysM repeat protein